MKNGSQIGLQVQLSKLDLQHFGVNTAKCVLQSIADLGVVNAFAMSHQVKLVIARVPANEIEVVGAAIRAGFILMDTLALYSYQYSQSTPAQPFVHSGIRKAVPADADEVRLLAARAFHGYMGHYHADPLLVSKACDDVYADWAYRSCISTELADTVLLKTIDEKIAGFGTLKLAMDGRSASGPLFAVDPSFKGQGIFTELLRSSKHWVEEKMAEEFLYSTQITNIAALRVLCREGFLPLRHEYTFHKWNNL